MDQPENGLNMASSMDSACDRVEGETRRVDWDEGSARAGEERLFGTTEAHQRVLMNAR